MAHYTVHMRCVVLKAVTVECDTEAQARDNPWDHAIDEIETDQVDWEVTSVEEMQ